jgi:hypothetical protein
MESKYNKNEWEQGTTLGRRLFAYNYGMRGNEFAGWELIKTIFMENELGVGEKIYMWKRKKSQEDELVQVSVTESSYWRHAQHHLMNQLQHCMRPDIPRGKGKTASIGDVQYIGQAPDSKEIAAVFFSRGNLQINVRSVGTKPVDVVTLAKKLDNRFIKPPTKTEEKAGLVSTLKPGKLKVKKAERAILLDKLPEPTPRSGWTKVLVPEGELRRDGDILYFTGEKAGQKSVEILNFKLE